MNAPRRVRPASSDFIWPPPTEELDALDARLHDDAVVAASRAAAPRAPTAEELTALDHALREAVASAAPAGGAAGVGSETTGAAGMVAGASGARLVPTSRASGGLEPLDALDRLRREGAPSRQGAGHTSRRTRSEWQRLALSRSAVVMWVMAYAAAILIGGILGQRRSRALVPANAAARVAMSQTAASSPAASASARPTPARQEPPPATATTEHPGTRQRSPTAPASASARPTPARQERPPATAPTEHPSTRQRSATAVASSLPAPTRRGPGAETGESDAARVRGRDHDPPAAAAPRVADATRLSGRAASRAASAVARGAAVSSMASEARLASPEGLVNGAASSGAPSFVSATPPPRVAQAAQGLAPESTTPVVRVPDALAMAAPAVPAPVAAAGASPEDSDAARIHGLLTRYARVYEQLDARAAAAIWPSVDRAALTRAFGGLQSQQVRLDRCRVTVAAMASTATASCQGLLSIVRRVGSTDPLRQPLQWTFHLERHGTDWRIASVNTAR